MTHPCQRALRATVAALLALSLAPGARAGVDDLVVVERGPFVGTDTAFLDALGSAVAFEGDRAVVGATLADSPAAEESGAAYVFVRAGTTWVQEAKLAALDATPGQSFGAAVAIDGDTIAVGASTDPEGAGLAGAVYVFVRAGPTWTQQQKLLADDPTALAGLGGAVALQGNTLVAGATLAGGALPLSGATYVFTRSEGFWSQATKLSALDGAPLAGYGSALALDGLTLCVGAEGDGGQGAAYVYVGGLSVWVQQAKLASPTPGDGDGFGAACALAGDLVVVGAPDDDTASGEDAGAAFAFARSAGEWSAGAPLAPVAPGAGGRFGAAVAVRVEGDERRALVGAPLDDGAGESSGSATLFERTGDAWDVASTLTASDADAQHRFGAAVALEAERALVGAPAAGAIGAPLAAGAAYVYDVLGPNGGETCAEARTIALDGAPLAGLAFDLGGASTDGPADAGCTYGPDVWYRWTADCDADVTVDSCGGTTLDTVLAVYAAATCPAAAEDLLACDDDTCGAQSSVAFRAVAGETYAIRVAAAGPTGGAAAFGTLSLEVDCDAQTPQCPFEMLATTAGTPPLRLADTLRTLYGLRDGVLRGTPVGERWTALYYRHAPAINGALARDRRLATRAGALVEALEPGLAALVAGDGRAERLPVPPRALVLLDRVIAGLEEADGDGALARALRAERARLDLDALAGASWAEAWRRVQGRGR